MVQMNTFHVDKIFWALFNYSAWPHLTPDSSCWCWIIEHLFLLLGPPFTHAPVTISVNSETQPLKLSFQLQCSDERLKGLITFCLRKDLLPHLEVLRMWPVKIDSHSQFLAGGFALISVISSLWYRSLCLNQNTTDPRSGPYFWLLWRHDLVKMIPIWNGVEGVGLEFLPQWG